ncbi:malto-oligosyltrehalose synthase [Streptomyces sp. CB01201]|uniref:malto-oligosyltrehalose synthase n=1 Tax=Streptomyces sp. CB01201 TaxID=2020324 RepID=UPI000C27B98C|nr:malto-oligosyltrehalose synthase [Streptomyces sp. CB01201]PJM98059.1 malto-oligosyltrehalose synthase [Streptomyces sp. CB01201]
MTPLTQPIATYRLQLQPGFPFAAAERALPYIAGLGVSHVHLSPVLEAVPGSTHGYDVTDHAKVREELGGESGLRQLSARAREFGLGLILDIVPNHMSAAALHNRQLWDVLRAGPASPYASWFDIDWEGGDGRVLLPVLAGPLASELDRLTVEGGVLRHGEQRFPLREGTAGLPMAELLDAQFYRLGWWRLARTELNYRRFFTIAELIGVRVEDEAVFAATHAKILELLADGVADGLRVDHPDGLADPEAYLRRLNEATGGRWTVVEKILTGDERLQAGWAVAGTTGYDALRHIDGLFTDPEGVRQLDAQYREFTAMSGDRGGRWEPTVRRAAYRVLSHELVAETEHLVRLAARICARGGPELRDHAPWALRLALCELLVRVPVYRPYRFGAEGALPASAALEAKAAFAVAEESAAVDVVRDLALGRLGEDADRARFRTRFAQTASALHAKSVEDTAFYRYTPLLSVNEVGGDPGRPSVDPAEFHAFCAHLARDWPATGTVLSTHDTKRSAEVRARIAVLSECPERWAALLDRLGEGPGAGAPDPQLAWVAWQTSVGLGGLPETERLEGALLKAVREAGLHTCWTEQDPGYEKAVSDFVAAGPGGQLAAHVREFVRETEAAARANRLGAALLHLTMPGVPDLYQGTEAEYAALVDPDNRRPVRFETAALAEPGDKLGVTLAALRLRRELPAVFGESGTHRALAARGPRAGHCVAFSRSDEVVTAVTRLSLRLAEAGGWAGTELVLPAGRWAEVIGGEREFSGVVPLDELFAQRPVALLRKVVREGGAGPG